MANAWSRRSFLGRASFGATSALATMCNLDLVGKLAAEEANEEDDYRAIVCVFLQGGNDSFNMLVPNEDPAYESYAATRSTLALSRESLLPIREDNGGGDRYGLHPSLSKLLPYYTGGKLAFLANVGTLREPTTKADFEQRPGQLPDGLFSHSDQQMQWQTAQPGRGGKEGWFARMSGLLDDLNDQGKYAAAISVSGSNLAQSGPGIGPFVITEGGTRGITKWNDANWVHGRAAVTSQLELDYANLFQKAYLQRKKDAIELNELFQEAVGDKDEELGVTFGEGKLSKQLEIVARVIRAREKIGTRRQTFFVMLGGWDLHSELLAPHTSLLVELGDALAGFQEFLDVSGLSKDVTTYTASDFGRSLTSNGQGSDHGWGGNQMILGGAVKGGSIFGEYPDLTLGGDRDVGRGRLVPSTSVDEYFAELACWFGVSQSQLAEVIPNLGRFVNLSRDLPAQLPGFMTI